MCTAKRLLVCLLVCAAFAFAAPTPFGPYPGNDNPQQPADLLPLWDDLEDFDDLFDRTLIELVTKVDGGDLEDNYVQDVITINTVNLNGSDIVGGTWESAISIVLVTYKAGPDFHALYYGIPGVTNGVWDTSALDDKNTSHISFWKYNGLPPGDPVVPEPSTWLMMSAGLGLLAIRAKRARRMR